MTIKESQVSQQREPAGRPQIAGRIVVGVDGSPGSLAALRWALSEAALRGVDVHAVGTWKFAGGMGYVMPGDAASPGEAMTTAMEATIAAAVALTSGGEAPPAVTITVSAVRGDPALELQRSVGDGDLLVVGSRGHGAAVGLLLGSVSQHVVAHAPCPVVVVPNLAHPEEGAPA